MLKRRITLLLPSGHGASLHCQFMLEHSLGLMSIPRSHFYVFESQNRPTILEHSQVCVAKITKYQKLLTSAASIYTSIISWYTG
ncbi:hypothetical protein AUEXF2481DRAFT_217410 [Aureobasidium subglaciale EXF-2481]|uniref:Uncharacterized protein n=1 Tax=Aureobasidium subglaciale (strain EXF-2481) TaxID=1043005 RepID=A0A074Z983_AURSE|nr:uncharacterized protein AUEXF2481DRAFT_217410 [Aureobasidium subglaciale EXF-2481]KEQ95391.1 hypothetical protein AUEXF2481DRAFT_217410 [Aureobasidium subglaciale EXF-2481]